jgi:hypothetical protein
MYKPILVGALLAGLCGVLVIALFVFKPATITATVVLKNDRAFEASVFVLENQRTKDIHKFQRNVATFDVLRNTPMKLVFAPKYKDAEYFGKEFRVEQHQVVTADCSSNSWSLIFAD